MSEKPIKILLVEDNPGDVRLIRDSLKQTPRDYTSPPKFEVIQTEGAHQAVTFLKTMTFDVVLLDLFLADTQGMETFELVYAVANGIPIVVLSREEDTEVVRQLLQQGAQDYLSVGNLDSNLLVRIIRHAVEIQAMREEMAQKEAELAASEAQRRSIISNNTELEQRNVALDEFAHTVAHQIQGLLSHMVGYASYVQMHYAGDLDDEANKAINQVVQSGRKMNNVITELLLLASVRTQDVELNPLDMGRIIEEVEKRLHDQIRENQAKLRKPDTWPTALGYGPWIEEVWLNYVSNGIKYGGPGAKIVLGATSLDNQMIRFWVQDNGPGISEADQKRLFKPHTRLTPKRVSGEGLGLAIVRRIVKKCGGEVGLESELGAGSLFWFTLPQAEE